MTMQSAAGNEEMGRRAARGVASTAISQIVKVLATLATTIVVARILTPSDYGVVAMVAPLTGLVLIFQNLGLNQAVVQVRNLDPEHSNALFWINTLASALAALVMVAASPLVANFYNDSRAGYVMAATGLTVFISGLKLQHQALLNREMRFKALSINDIAVAVSTFVFTTLAAITLRSYWAIWWGYFLGTAVSTVMMWRASGWRPSLRARFAGVSNMLVFGANLTGFNLVNFLARNLDNVIIAKARGAAEVGLYDRSYRLMLFPLQNINQPLSRVMVPALSRLQDEPERYRRAYTLAIRALVMISMPGIFTAAICSDRLVPFLLGERWAAASPIFFWLSLTAIIQSVPNTAGWLYISSGNTRKMMWWGVFSSSISIASFFVGVQWGATGVALAYFIGQVVTTPILYYHSTKGTPIPQSFMYTVQIPSLLGGLASWGVASRVSSSLDTIELIIVTLAVSYVATLTAQFCAPAGRKAMMELAQLAWNLLPVRIVNLFRS